MFWDWRDIVHSFALSADGWFHGLVDSVVGVGFWQLVVLALDQVLGLSVNLQLRNDSLDHVGFIVGGLSVEGD